MALSLSQTAKGPDLFFLIFSLSSVFDKGLIAYIAILRRELHQYKLIHFSEFTGPTFLRIALLALYFPEFIPCVLESSDMNCLRQATASLGLRSIFAVPFLKSIQVY